METEDIRVEKEDLRQAVEKLTNDGTDMKQEIQALKKVEKVLKVSRIQHLKENTMACIVSRRRVIQAWLFNCEFVTAKG